MAKSKIAPQGKAVEQLDLSMYRIMPTWTQPLSVDGNIWREIARKQPVIADCVTNLTMYAQSLPWDIRVRDVEKIDKLQSSVETYKKIFVNAQDGAGYLTYISLLLQDFYLLPFGGGTETIRYPDKTLYSIRQIDGATLFPYDDKNMPVMQYVPAFGNPNRSVNLYFTPDELVRMYQFPRPEIHRRGWGMAQPEKIYFALELLNRGDKYYANLLLDTPEAGLLDLGDMSEASATKWLESFKNLFTGIDAFKIPVLYEHTIPANYLPFGRAPNVLEFENITMRYIQLVTAAFGITPSDLGIKGGGGSGLSGQIREERQSRSTGKAFIRNHLLEHFNRILPDEFQFIFVDTDDELLVARGRARSANAVAGRNLIESGAITPAEWRKQLKTDGLITIPLVDEPEASEFDILGEIDGTADQVRIQEEQLKIQEKVANTAATVATNNGGKISGNPRKNNQGGFGLNKQRNVRGGKLQQVQGKEPVPASAGGVGEIKSEVVEKSDLSDLRQVLASGLSTVVDEAEDVRLRKLIKSAIRQLYPTLKSASNNPDVEEWTEKYITSVFSGKSEFGDEVDGELVTKSINDIIRSLDSIFTKESWWRLPITESDVSEILLNAYEKALRDTAIEIQRALYEDSIVDTPTVTKDFSVLKKSILDAIDERAAVLIALLDDGTEFYLKRLSLGVLSDTLRNPIYQKLLADSTDVETVLTNQSFLNDVIVDLRGNFSDLMLRRSETASDYEVERITNMARLDQFKTVGFTRKGLVHLGNDTPCVECQDMESLGFVPLDYVYRTTKFGDTLYCPIHPSCHHRNIFDTKELGNIDPNIFTNGEK